MKNRLNSIVFLLCALGCVAGCVNTADVDDSERSNVSLEERFTHPSDEAKPWVYWFWMDGNITKEGITADLEAMDRVGIEGALIMGVGLNTPPGPADFNSPEWRELYRHVGDEARRLGMQITLHQCDGWATSGGPWITPDRSMKVLVWSSTTVDGSDAETIQLKQPEAKLDYYEDVAVYAVPAADDSLTLPKEIQVNGEARTELTDGDGATAIEEVSEIEIDLGEAQTLSTVQFLMEYDFHVKLQDTPTTVLVSEDGKTFTPVVDFDLNVCNRRAPQLTVTASFTPVQAKVIRIKCKKPTFGKVEGIELFSGPRVHLWEAKCQFARERGEHGGETFWFDAQNPDLSLPGLDRKNVINLTDKLSADGTLDWKAPAGRWMVYRLGMSTNGKYVQPETNAGLGLEVDKMSAEALNFHFDSFAKGMIAENNKEKGHPIFSVHSDSWECDTQTWTHEFMQEFEKRRGYSMLPYLPVLSAGVVVGGSKESERFLWDLRRTMADLIADNFYGALREKCHENGVLFQSEAAGMQMLVYDPLNYAAKTDIYVGEFWKRHPGHYLRPDCKVGASTAHTYGRPFAAAESFTAGFGTYGQDLFDFKVLGDLAFCAGVNRYIIHRYCMQPFNNVEPGMTFGPYGIIFDRGQTWWENGAKAFCDYATRCQSLLQTGTFAADVIHYIGHDAPNYLGFRDEIWNPIPAGYDFDGCNLEILQRLDVEKDGTLTLPSGMRYRVLLLPGREHMTIEAAREVERLVNAGAVVVGKKPLRTPGLHDWEKKDAELAQIVSRVWKKVSDEPLETVLNHIAPPDFDYDAPEDVKLNYIHRYTDEADLYFVANENPDAAADTILRFRVSGKQPELWDPSTGAMKPVEAWRERDGITELPVHFDPAGSWFVVFRKPAKAPADSDFSIPSETVVTTLKGPWAITFPPNRQAPASIELPELVDWSTHSDDGVKYFSGTATYTKTFNRNGKGGMGAVLLDLGAVENIAEVILNGKDLGTLWKPPFKVDVSGALVEGENTLEVKVTNLWPNRLIGDHILHPDPGLEYRNAGRRSVQKFIPDWVRNGGKSPVGRTTWVLWDLHTIDEPLLPSGLLGPVQLKQVR